MGASYLMLLRHFFFSSENGYLVSMVSNYMINEKIQLKILM